MDKIIAKGLAFWGCHGVLPTEKLNPQKFIIDLELYKELKVAGETDDLTKTVNYDEVYHTVKKVVEESSFALIEALAENIARKLLFDFPVQAVKVTLYKPQAPVNGEFDYFAVEIFRSFKHLTNLS